MGQIARQVVKYEVIRGLFLGSSEIQFILRYCNEFVIAKLLTFGLSSASLIHYNLAIVILFFIRQVPLARRQRRDLCSHRV